MADNTENLVLELPRQMRNDMAGFRTEMRLGLVEQALSSMLAVSASDRDEMRNVET